MMYQLFLKLFRDSCNFHRFKRYSASLQDFGETETSEDIFIKLHKWYKHRNTFICTLFDSTSLFKSTHSLHICSSGWCWMSFSEWQRPALRQTRVQDVVPLRPPLNPPLRETFSSTSIHPHFFYIRLDSFSWKGCEPQPWKISTNKFPPTRKSPNGIFGNETRQPLAKFKNTWTEKKGKSRGILKGGCLETVLKAVGRTMSVSDENLN